MTAVLIEFAFLAGVIFVVGAFMSRFADEIAEITGFGRLLVGSVLLAGATSLPELTVDITAVRLGETDLAAGDLLGSSLMNLLILAVLDLTFYSRGKMLSREAAGHALSGTLSMTLTSFVGVAVLTAPKMPNFEFIGLCIPTWGIVIAYILGVRVVFLDQRLSAHAAKEAQAQAAASNDSAHAAAATHDLAASHAPAWSQSPTAHALPPLWKPMVGFAIATVVLLFAGPRMAHAAAKLAELSGLGNTFVGTTLVAFSTSLPELVSSLVAIRMKAFDLAVGNVFGSNAFNMILFAVLDFMHAGPVFTAISPSHLVTCLAGISATAIAIMGQLYRVESRRKFLEPDAWLVITVCLGALAIIYRMS